jgi:hypothetical protein
MQLQDLDAVVAIAGQVHPLFPEERYVFANKLDLHPAGALVLEHAGRPAGYCFALPWHGVQPPALNTLLDAISPAADALYLHDHTPGGCRWRAVSWWPSTVRYRSGHAWDLPSALHRQCRPGLLRMARTPV